MTIIGDKNIKELTGEVVSDKTNKTRTILVKKVKMHPIYKKRFVVSKNTMLTMKTMILKFEIL